MREGEMRIFFIVGVSGLFLSSKVYIFFLFFPRSGEHKSKKKLVGTIASSLKHFPPFSRALLSPRPLFSPSSLFVVDTSRCTGNPPASNGFPLLAPVRRGERLPRVGVACDLLDLFDDLFDDLDPLSDFLDPGRLRRRGLPSCDSNPQRSFGPRSSVRSGLVVRLPPGLAGGREAWRARRVRAPCHGERRYVVGMEGDGLAATKCCPPTGAPASAGAMRDFLRMDSVGTPGQRSRTATSFEVATRAPRLHSAMRERPWAANMRRPARPLSTAEVLRLAAVAGLYSYHGGASESAKEWAGGGPGIAFFDAGD